MVQLSSARKPIELEVVRLIVSFIQSNSISLYGAIVGTIALALNFMRYRHALNSSKIDLKVEIIEKMGKDAFLSFLDKQEDDGYRGSINSAITHTVKIRNISNVTAHIEDVWVENKDGKEFKGTKRASNNQLIYMPVSELGGNLEIKPRSSISLSVFSEGSSGFINPKIAFASDETGRKWKSKYY